MKRILFPLVVAAFVSGCAAYGPDVNGAGSARAASDMSGNPIYGPAPGVHLGIGIGSWGGRTGTAAGIGYGW